jgi:hypothetical protein
MNDLNEKFRVVEFQGRYYPQYQGFFGGWKYYTGGNFDADPVCLSLEEARQYIRDREGICGDLAIIHPFEA